jgi:hypothetical protein
MEMQTGNTFYQPRDSYQAVDVPDSLMDKYKYSNRYTEYKKLYLKWVVLCTLMSIGLYFEYQYNGYLIPQSNYYYSYIETINNNTLELNAIANNYVCTTDTECGESADCKLIIDIFGNYSGSKCICHKSYITVDANICQYHQLSGWIALILSIFTGLCGVDRCFIARGNLCGICAGCIKGLTVGGIGIWWLLDIIFIATGTMYDGNWQKLYF